MAFTVATFIAFTVLVAVLSWWKTRDDDLSTKEGYFLAGRGLTGLVIAGSLEMTNLSTEQLVGQAGQSYSTNMGAMSWSVNASIALLALAMLLRPKHFPLWYVVQLVKGISVLAILLSLISLIGCKYGVIVENDDIMNAVRLWPEGRP